jgi:hypothetical protein
VGELEAELRKDRVASGRVKTKGALSGRERGPTRARRPPGSPRSPPPCSRPACSGADSQASRLARKIRALIFKKNMDEKQCKTCNKVMKQSVLIIAIQLVFATFFFIGLYSSIKWLITLF